MVQTLSSPSALPYPITWDKLPDDFILPDEPVDNLNQPSLAAALTEGLANAGKLSATSLATTNYGLCARCDQKFVVKAPDWAYMAKLTVPKIQVERSYTPYLQGDPPAIVMEFISDTDGGEYSIKASYPPGKWFFYEQILKVPYYVLFDWQTDALEVYRLNGEGSYQRQIANEAGRFWIDTVELELGVWWGDRECYHRAWLRWWTAAGELVPWSSEQVQQEKERTKLERQRAESERQRAESERQRAESERLRADRLADLLRSQGIDPETL